MENSANHIKEEKDKLFLIKERIEKEIKFGDKAQACRNAGITPTTFDRGLSKDSFDKLSAPEYNGIVELIKILNLRRDKLSEIESFIS